MKAQIYLFKKRCSKKFQRVDGMVDKLYSAHLLQAMQHSLFIPYNIFRLTEYVPDGLI